MNVTCIGTVPLVQSILILTVLPYRACYFFVPNPDPRYCKYRTDPDAQDARASPPPPQPERLVKRKDEAVGNKKRMQVIYLRLDNFFPRIITVKAPNFDSDS